MARLSRFRPNQGKENEQPMSEQGTQRELFTADENATGESADSRIPPREFSELEQAIIDEAESVIKSKSFLRLYDVTFLGILSPRYADLPGHPITNRKVGKPDLVDDGSRADHSLAVAALVARFCDAFSLSINAKRYGIAWALVHDIATWPLSHTGEAAFSTVTGITHKHLRQKMVAGDRALPSEFHLSVHLREMGVDPGRLVRLFEKKKITRSTKENKEFLHLCSLIHSAITPDTLEGIYRSGVSLGIQVPNPESVLDSFEINEVDFVNDTIIRRRGSKPVLEFWRKKRKIYDAYINAPRTVAYESRWSYGIRTAFECISIAESLHLNEADVVARVSETGLPAQDSVFRYKAPQSYFLHDSLKHRRTLRADYPIEDLSDMLRRSNKNTEAG